MTIFRKLGVWVGLIRLDVVMLGFAFFHPQTPWYVRGLCLFGVAYVLSPIDLIPDFVPVLGLMDDALVMTAVIWLSMRLLPETARGESRARAEHWLQTGKKGLLITGLLALLFVVVLGGGLLYLLWRALMG
ncbi:YkvA family protein [Neisseriaceae bacterium JH1-16]|nr:YkvA family protein [Neisseriaceae bacterium JH1-16]